MATKQELEARVAELEAQLRILKDVNVAPIVLPTEVVVLDGAKHQIVERGRMFDLVDQWRKKLIEDDDLVLVVKKA